MPRIRASWRASSVLPTPVGPANRKLPIGLSGERRPGARQLDGRRHLVDRRVLAEDDALQLGVERGQRALVVARHRLHRHARHLGDDLLDLRGADRVAPSARSAGSSFCAAPASSSTSIALSGRCRSLQVLRRQRHRGRERLVGVVHAVMRLVVRAQPLEDLERLGSRTARARRSSGSGATARGPGRTTA